MKKWAIILVFGIWGCSDSSDDFGTPDQIFLLSDREVVCPGQTATLRIFSTLAMQEIPNSEFVFDPLPVEQGSISQTGIYTAPNSIQSPQAEISGTFRSKIKLSFNLKFSNGSNLSQGGVEITPFDFFNANEGRPFFFWPDGSIVLGTGRYMPESLKKFEIIRYSNQGDLLWKMDLGTGEAKFLEVLEDKIYAAGSLFESGEAVFNVVMILDLEGNVVWEKKIPITPQHVFEGFQVDNEKNFYISTTLPNLNTIVTKLTKYNSQGDDVWVKEPGFGFYEIFIFPNGNIVAKGFTDYYAEMPLVSFFDRDGNLLRSIETDIPGISFKGPTGTFGLAYPGVNLTNQTSFKYFDLFNSQGLKIVSNKMVGSPESFSGRLENPAQKKIANAGLSCVFTDSSGQVHLFSAAFWGYYDFLTLNSSTDKNWIWWNKNKESIPEGDLYPLQILEDGENLILLAHSNGKLLRFRLGKDYSFDDCLREPYWNKVDML